MKNKKYTQKKIIIRSRRRSIHLNNNMINSKILKELQKDKNILKSGWSIGIIAKKNKRLTQEQINTIKQDINNQRNFNLKLIKYFIINIKLKPNKVITSKGILVRMGKGKGKIRTKGINILKNTVCIELKLRNIKNNLNLTPSYINILFSKFLKKYTFFKIRTLI